MLTGSDSYLQLGDVEKALELTRRNQRTTSQIRDLCDIAHHLLDSGEEQAVRELVDEIEPAVEGNQGRLRSRAEAAARFVSVLSRLGEEALAREILGQAEMWLENADLKPRWKKAATMEVLAEVAVAYCQVGDYVRGFELLGTVDDDQEVVIALLRVFEEAYESQHEFTKEELDAMLRLCPSADEDEAE